MSDPSTLRLLRVSDVARIVGAAESTVRLWIREKRLPSRKIGRLVRVHPEDLDRMINGEESNKNSSEGDLIL